MQSKMKSVLKVLKAMFFHNLGMKLMSLMFAIFLWSYLIYSNPAITSNKSISGIDINVTGHSVLTSRDLAVLTDVTALTPATVVVEVPQSNYSGVTADGVRVELDLTSIRQAGKQQVKLRGTSSTGRVVQVRPETVELTVEKLAQRYAPSQIELINRNPNYWYNPISSQMYPQQILVSGPESIVEQIDRALVSCDVDGATSKFVRTLPFKLLNSAHEEVPSGALTKATSFVSIAVDVYPEKTLPVTNDANEILTGVLPDGLEIESITIQPESITVAGDQELLERMTASLSIQDISLAEKTSTFSEVRRVLNLDSFKYKSTDQVTVTVAIREKTVSERFSGISVSALGKSDSMAAALSLTKVDIRATGAYSVIHSLKKGDLIATVNIEGLEPGVYDLPVEVMVDNEPGLTFAVEPATIRVDVTAK